jgi:hypothetical protein
MEEVKRDIYVKFFDDKEEKQVKDVFEAFVDCIDTGFDDFGVPYIEYQFFNCSNATVNKILNLISNLNYIEVNMLTSEV